MIELTEEQIHTLAMPQAKPPRVVNPRTQETFVLLPLAEFERLGADEPDYSPWTDEETALLAAEAGELLDSFGKEP